MYVSCLILLPVAQTRPSSMKLNRKEREWTSMSSSDLRRKGVTLWPLGMILALSFFCWCTLSVWGSSLLFLVSYFLSWRGIGFWQINAFYVSIEMVMWFLSVILLVWHITILDFWMLNQPYAGGISLSLSGFGIR